MLSDDQKKGLARMREPFAENQINVLPKPYSKDSPKEFCRTCNSRHGMPAAHLDYVGHAALTDRLLEVDPEWTWEPLALDEQGLPRFDRNGGLWIKLTICGVTRLGYGDTGGKNGANAVKEAIGDALRNGGMRFGAALDLWHKGELHDASQEREREAPTEPPASAIDVDELLEQMASIESVGDLRSLWDRYAHALGDRHDEVAAFVRLRRKQIEQPEQQTLDA